MLIILIKYNGLISYDEIKKNFNYLYDMLNNR